eukprot:scaffold284365_cov26-Tisochrysis_lutea.AAC.3
MAKRSHRLGEGDGAGAERDDRASMAKRVSGADGKESAQALGTELWRLQRGGGGRVQWRGEAADTGGTGSHASIGCRAANYALRNRLEQRWPAALPCECQFPRGRGPTGCRRRARRRSSSTAWGRRSGSACS